MTFLTIFGFHFKNLGEFPTQLDLDVLGGSTSQPARPPPTPLGVRPASTLFPAGYGWTPLPRKILAHVPGFGNGGKRF